MDCRNARDHEHTGGSVNRKTMTDLVVDGETSSNLEKLPD
jgi:hypothetical protein